MKKKRSNCVRDAAHFLRSMFVKHNLRTKVEVVKEDDYVVFKMWPLRHDKWSISRFNKVREKHIANYSNPAYELEHDYYTLALILKCPCKKYKSCIKWLLKEMGLNKRPLPLKFTT